MEAYLMMVYVTLDQENALKAFFIQQGWPFCKPDLRVTTDCVGPLSKREIVTSNELSQALQSVPPPSVMNQSAEAKVRRPMKRTAYQSSKRSKALVSLLKKQKVDIEQSSLIGDNIKGPQDSLSAHTETETEFVIETIDDTVDQSGDNLNDSNDRNVSVKVEQVFPEFNVEASELDFHNSSNEELLNESTKSNNKDNDDKDGDDADDNNIADEEDNGDVDNDNIDEAAEDEEVSNEKPGPSHDVKTSQTDKKIKQSKRQFECRMCGAVLKTSLSLKLHEQRHSGIGLYTCCNQEFYHKTTLERHMCTAHGQKPSKYTCSQCQETFNTASDLRRHKLREKAGTGFYRCSLCNAMYQDRLELLTHLDWHEVEKHYACLDCKKTFRQRISLTKHRAAKHKQTT